jgi:hypothetical protein
MAVSQTGGAPAAAAGAAAHQVSQTGYASTIPTNLGNILTRTYGREDYIAPHERVMAKFYDSLEEVPGTPIYGAAQFFPIFTADSWAVGGVAEAGDLPNFEVPAVLQANVAPVQIAASLAFSELLAAVGQADGMIAAKDIIDYHVKMTVRDLMARINWYTLGHGTGRLAVVESTTAAVSTFVCRLPEHVLQLRKGMRIDFYNTDTGGSKQGNTYQIQSINFETRTVTLNTTATLTAGWGVYQALGAATTGTSSTYGIATNGLRNIVDDSTLSSTLFGITRSTNPEVNATVLTAGGGLQSYSEKLVRKGINRIKFQVGLEPNEMWCNNGIISEHLNHLTGSRVYQVMVDQGVPKYQIGQTEQSLGFQNNGKFIPFKVDNDLPARELYIVTKDLFRKHMTRRPNWVGDNVGPDGSATPYLFQAPSTSGGNYALAKVAGMLAIFNITHRQPRANTKISEIADEELGGDTVV